MLPERNGHLGPMGKLNYRINNWVDIAVATCLKLETIGPNWLVTSLFAQNTLVNFSTGTTFYEVVFCLKPQIPFPLKLGLAWDDNELCQSDLCQSLPNHTHVSRKTSHPWKDRFFILEILEGFTYPRDSLQRYFLQGISESPRSQSSVCIVPKQVQICWTTTSCTKILLGKS